MNFRVLWPQRVMRELTRAYLVAREAGEADAVTTSMAEVDAHLSANPTTAGESRDGAERILVIRPVVVEYEVFEDERVVVLTAARYFRRRRA
jgi:hypothetical protein